MFGKNLSLLLSDFFFHGLEALDQSHLLVGHVGVHVLPDIADGVFGSRGQSDNLTIFPNIAIP